jgi:hypothetical protein
MIHTYVGGVPRSGDLADVDLERNAASHPRDSSAGTGDGTDHDDTSIRERPTYTYEGVFTEPLRSKTVSVFCVTAKL